MAQTSLYWTEGVEDKPNPKLHAFLRCIATDFGILKSLRTCASIAARGRFNITISSPYFIEVNPLEIQKAINKTYPNAKLCLNDLYTKDACELDKAHEILENFLESNFDVDNRLLANSCVKLKPDTIGPSNIYEPREIIISAETSTKIILKINPKSRVINPNTEDEAPVKLIIQNNLPNGREETKYDDLVLQTIGTKMYIYPNENEQEKLQFLESLIQFRELIALQELATLFLTNHEVIDKFLGSSQIIDNYDDVDRISNEIEKLTLRKPSGVLVSIFAKVAKTLVAPIASTDEDKIMELLPVVPYEQLKECGLPETDEVFEAAGLTSLIDELVPYFVFDPSGTDVIFDEIQQIFTTIIGSRSSEVIRFLSTELPALQRHLHNTQPAPLLDNILPRYLDIIDMAINDAITKERMLRLNQLLNENTISRATSFVRSIFVIPESKPAAFPKSNERIWTEIYWGQNPSHILFHNILCWLLGDSRKFRELVVTIMKTYGQLDTEAVKNIPALFPRSLAEGDNNGSTEGWFEAMKRRNNYEMSIVEPEKMREYISRLVGERL